MCDKYVYLAGPIAGQTYDQSNDWRINTGDRLRELGMVPLSPMRGKDPQAFVPGFDRESTPLTSARGIKARDKYDVHRSSAVLANFLGATDKSIGTACEFSWADDAGVPVIAVMEPSGNPNDHPFIRETAFCVVTTLGEAIEVLRWIVLP
ncbi:MAG: nucleoside 2-deoxyribosyltransferase [Patescibacteria group bacterium]